jgi:RNA recognition motif-containing protein
VESKLYVGNLSSIISEGDLERLFAQAGEVKDVAMIMDRTTRQSKGFGFVEMANEADAQKAIEMFNNYELDGKPLVVNLARPREDRPGGPGGSRGGFGTHHGGGGHGGFHGGSRRR